VRAAVVLWQSIFLPGCEWCELARDNDGWRIAGTVLAAIEGEPGRIEYAIALDSNWSTRQVTVDCQRGPDPRYERLRLTVDAEQRWYVARDSSDGSAAAIEEIAALRGLVDVDLGFSPVTNTLPIRRLDPAIGEAVDVTAAWVRFPELTLEPLPQRYIRLDERRYRYESRGGAFTAELVVDGLGLVVTYEGGWRRVGGGGGEGGGTALRG
jgi:hypothetical protein